MEMKRQLLSYKTELIFIPAVIGWNAGDVFEHHISTATADRQKKTFFSPSSFKIFLSVGFIPHSVSG